LSGAQTASVAKNDSWSYQSSISQQAHTKPFSTSKLFLKSIFTSDAYAIGFGLNGEGCALNGPKAGNTDF
jgi:hypothetical protein